MPPARVQTSPLRRLASRPRAYVSLVAIALVGVAHRTALPATWVDDRVLAGEPAWFQLAAPLWHSAIPGSASLSALLTDAIDPLTGASPLGDARGIAATCVAGAAAALLIVLQRMMVPQALAIVMCGALVGALLQVAAWASVAHALQMLCAAALLLVMTTKPRHVVRVAVISAVTVIGTASHPAFAAFAAAAWAVEVRYAPPAIRIRVAAIAAVALIAAVAGPTWILVADIGGSANAAIPTPPMTAVAAGLVSGRFPIEMQPHGDINWREAIALLLPAPLLLCLPLIAAGAAHATRRVVLVCVAQACAVLAFSACTWLPDRTIALASGRVALLIASAAGVSWLWAQRDRASRAVGIAAATYIGLAGFAGIAHVDADADNAEVLAFADAARSDIGTALWSADRLTTARALLLRSDRAFRDTRLWSGPTVLAAVPAEKSFVALSGVDRPRRTGGAWLIPRDISHPTAATFLASQPSHRWLAAAVRGGTPRDDCRALAARLGVDADSTASLALLVKSGERAQSSAMRLDARFGQRTDLGELVPASFSVVAAPEAHITINAVASTRLTRGMVLALFDPWRLSPYSFALTDCARPTWPPIEDRRLKAAYLFEARGEQTVPQVPIVDSAAVYVNFSDVGGAWFRGGWHTPESDGDRVFRWTSALRADVNALVTRRQPLRIRLQARLAERQPGSNVLSILWNGTSLTGAMNGQQGELECTVPGSLVQRGMNVLSVAVVELVAPSQSGNTSDPRLLGAAVSALSIEPIPDATAPASTMAPR